MINFHLFPLFNAYPFIYQLHATAKCVQLKHITMWRRKSLGLQCLKSSIEDAKLSLPTPLSHILIFPQINMVEVPNPKASWRKGVTVKAIPPQCLFDWWVTILKSKFCNTCMFTHKQPFWFISVMSKDNNYHSWVMIIPSQQQWWSPFHLQFQPII